jgi:hypothetical protein
MIEETAEQQKKHKAISKGVVKFFVKAIAVFIAWQLL